MKHIKLFSAIIVLASIFFSCSGNNVPKQKNENTPNASQASNTDAGITGTNGIFSYTVNGQHVDARNYVQPANLFINEVTNDPANGMLTLKVTCETSSVFHFIVSNSGTTTITDDSPSLGGFTDKKAKVASYMDGKTYKSFYGQGVTVNITSINDSRVTGTFSGAFKADENDGGTTINITDGNFNLPFGKN